MFRLAESVFILIETRPKTAITCTESFGAHLITKLAVLAGNYVGLLLLLLSCSQNCANVELDRSRVHRRAAVSRGQQRSAGSL
jgi:hypothetical protein